LIQKQIAAAIGRQIKIVDTGKIVAASLDDYLKRHPEIKGKLGKNKKCQFLTTDRPEDFERLGSKFLDKNFQAEKISLTV
jgi:glutamate racemase